MSCMTILVTDKSEVTAHERYGHVCVIYADRYLIVFGGLNNDTANTQYLSSIGDNNINPIYIFDTHRTIWKSYTTKGELGATPISRLSGACGLIHDHFLYIFAGFAFGRHTNRLYRLNLKLFEWTLCKSGNTKLPSPRDKFNGWVHDNKLFFFGGFGLPLRGSYIDECGDFDADDELKADDDVTPLGWNNQLVYYDTTKGTWHNPIYKEGPVPLPRAGHSCMLMPRNQVVLFGGRTKSARTNDLYVLDLNNYSWKGNLNTLTNQNPIGRSWTTMVKLNDKELLIYGGFSGNHDALGDVWTLNLQNLTWNEVKIRNLEKRLWHTANIVDRSKDVYVFGGCFRSFENLKPQLPKHIIRISIYPEPLIDKCLNFICSNNFLYQFNIRSLPADLQETIKQKISLLLAKPTEEKTI